MEMVLEAEANSWCYPKLQSVMDSDTKGSPLAQQRAMWNKGVGGGKDPGDNMDCEHS